MTLKLSKRHEWVLQSEIRNMSIECDKVGGINLSQGICDTGVPEVVAKAAKKAMDDGFNSYTRYDGLPIIREAIAHKVKTFTGMDVDRENQITVSSGATGALYCTCLALLDPGDEVIIFEPYYGYHINTLMATQAVPVYVTMSPPDWTFTMEALEKAVTPKTRAILVCSPANPSGKVWTREELLMVADVAEKNDLFVFTDEIYEYFVFDGKDHLAPATLPELRERTITISGLSKTFSITGWRIGYCIADARWSQTIGYFNDLVYVCAPAPLQVGVAEGLLKLPPEYFQGLSKEYQKKRDLICGALSGAGFEPYVPQGAYYVLADISRIQGKDSKERAMKILQETGVACVPGKAFFHNDAGDNLARFCFAKDTDVLTNACDRLTRLK